MPKLRLQPFCSLVVSLLICTSFAQADQDVIRTGQMAKTFSKVGDRISERAKKKPDDCAWFVRLSDSEQQRVIKELNDFTITFSDKVKLPGGDEGRAQFSDDALPRVMVEPAPAASGKLNVKPVMATLLHDGTKEVFLQFKWTPAKGHELHLNGVISGLSTSFVALANLPPMPMKSSE